ncbi:MAG: hypothetical protein IKI15_11730 [Lachnospiraceae bacterium]|nr:hypothetical protein [Lachnospiraceae bacterium]
MILDLLIQLFKGLGWLFRTLFFSSYECLFVIIFVAFTHVLLCKFFVVYEAVTYECSLAAVLLTIMNMHSRGITVPNLVAFGICFVAFLLNALSQRHFYGKLKNIVNDVFLTRYFDPKNKNSGEDMKDIISRSVVPSFSRFIEESKLLNNPANLFGLIKRTLSRDRFQKRKFMIRERSAELLNYTSFHDAAATQKAVAEGRISGNKKQLPGVIITPEDLALDYSDEKKGLFSFDFLGFGALFGSMIYVYMTSSDSSSVLLPQWGLYLLLIFVGFASYLFRRIAFQRNNSLFTELACVAFFPVLYIFSTGTFHSADWTDYTAFIISVVLIFVIFFIYGRSGKIRQKKAQAQFKDLLDDKSIRDYPAETKRIIINCLESLLFLCPSVLEPLSFRMFQGEFQKGKKAERFKHEKSMVGLAREITGFKKNPFEVKDLTLEKKHILISYGIIIASLIFLCVTAFIYS